MNYRIFLLFFCFFTLTECCFAQDYLRFPHERLFKNEDVVEWKDPDLGDAEWTPDIAGISSNNFWVRFKIKCDSITDTFVVPGMEVISLGSYEVYWDGQLIGKNGQVGKSKEEEIPGKFLSRIPLADSLLSHGIHTVTFRVSNHHSPFNINIIWNNFFLEEYQYSQQRDLKLTAKIFILAGIYLMAAIYYLFLFFIKKREALGFIFSMLCLLFFSLIIAEYLKFLYAYTYPVHNYRLYAIYFLTLIITFLTPYFFIRYFKLPYQWLLAGSILCSLIIISLLHMPNMDGTNWHLSRAMWWSSVVITSYAVFMKKKDSRIILFAVLLSGLVVRFPYMNFRVLLYSQDITLFISFSILVLSMMYLLAQRAREQKQAYEASLLLSSRLQNELLKKNIQPHFIMNTLTSLMAWVEESPKESVHFIEALSKEFEVMSAIAEEKLIPVEQEIELCRYHIEIMKYRKEVDYIFECENIKEGELVPPAIFHTIIENGITHSIPNASNQIKMVLRFNTNHTEKCYQLRTYAESRKSEIGEEGTGTKYIKSRLEENFGDQWTLTAAPFEEGWETLICLKNNPAQK